MNNPDPTIDVITDVAAVASDPVPTRVRTAVLAAIRQRTAALQPPSADAGPPEAAPFATQVAELDALLSGLTPAQWSLPVPAVQDSWDVSAVLAHVFSVDALLAAELDLPLSPEAGSGTDIAARTESAQRAFAGRPAKDVHAAWRGQAIALLNHVSARPEHLERRVNFAGLRLPVGAVLLDRAGETWIHSEDVRSVLARPSVPLRPDHREVLADGGAQLLPTRWPEMPIPAAGPVWLRLQGTHVSDWLIEPAGPARRPQPDEPPAAATVTVDTLEFCYLLGGRRTPDTVEHEASGDALLARATLAAAAGMARL